MNKKATPPLPEKPATDKLDTGGLTDKTREKYLLALNELVGTLSIKHSKRVDVADFCKRHDLRESFFDALRDLEALMLDHLKSEIDEPYYQATEKLVEVTPAQVVSQMKASGRADRTRKTEADKWELISSSGLVQQPESPVAEENAVVATENHSEPAVGVPPGGPVGDTLATMRDEDFKSLLLQQDLAALDYLAEHLSVIADLEFDFSLFYKQFPGQVDLIRFLIREGMLLEISHGKYPLYRITHKLMAAIQQKTLHPIIQTVESQITEPTTEATEATYDPTTPADKLKCPSVDCSTAMCPLCWDDAEKREHLLSQSVPENGSKSSDLEDEIMATQRLTKAVRDLDDVQKRPNQPLTRQPEMISSGADFAVLPLQHPYNIDIEAHDLRLNMNVSTTEDAAIVEAITFKLKRQTVAA